MTADTTWLKPGRRERTDAGQREEPYDEYHQCRIRPVHQLRYADGAQGWGTALVVQIEATHARFTG